MEKLLTTRIQTHYDADRGEEQRLQSLIDSIVTNQHVVVSNNYLCPIVILRLNKEILLPGTQGLLVQGISRSWVPTLITS